MTALWSWGSTPIYVSEEAESREIYRTLVKVLDATENTLHFFGAGSMKVELKALVVGRTNRSNIEIDAYSDTTRAFTAPSGSLGNFKINGTPKFTMIKYAGGVIDGVTVVAGTDELFDVEMELIGVT